MVTLYDRISALCESRGIKGGKMCTDTGISKGLLTDLKMGRRTGVSAVTALKIADYFGITVDELYGKEPSENEEKPTNPKIGELSEDELEVIEDLRRLAQADWDTVRRIIKSFSAPGEK